jgi:hypothetical protein
LIVICPGIKYSIRYRLQRLQGIKMQCKHVTHCFGRCALVALVTDASEQGPLPHTCTHAGCLVQELYLGDTAACYAHCKEVTGITYAEYNSGFNFPKPYNC